MVAQEEIKEDEEKPDEPKPDEPPPVTTGIVGNGPPDGFGLSAGKGGTGGSGQIGGGRRSGSKFGWYGAKVQSTITSAIRSHSKLRLASFSGTTRVWVDSTGRITRATFTGTDENGAEQILEGDVLQGLTLPEAPPADMPMPIVMRTTARRPSSMASR